MCVAEIFAKHFFSFFSPLLRSQAIKTMPSTKRRAMLLLLFVLVAGTAAGVIAMRNSGTRNKNKNKTEYAKAEHDPMEAFKLRQKEKDRAEREADKKKNVKAKLTSNRNCLSDVDCPDGMICVSPGICAPVEITASGAVDTNNNDIAGKGREGESDHLKYVRIMSE